MGWLVGHLETHTLFSLFYLRNDMRINRHAIVTYRTEMLLSGFKTTS